MVCYNSSLFVYFQTDAEKTASAKGPSPHQYEVLCIERKSEADRKKPMLTLSFSPNKIPAETIQTPQDNDPESGQL